MNQPLTVLVVLDGWGIDATHEHNGIHLAHTPNYDRLVQDYPYTELHASGEHVGLPEGQMGNSEVGHTTIGAGCVIYQDLVRISKDAGNGDFLHNPAMQQAFTHAKSHHSQLHILGLLSSGGVHAHEDHLIEVAKAAKAAGVESIVFHPFLDGRDAPPTAGAASLEKLETVTGNLGGTIATVCGRYYAMDRDTNWDRTDKAFQAVWYGNARQEAATVQPSTAVRQRYATEQFDEHLEPLVFLQKTGKPVTVNKNDSIIFTNFRTDRVKQLGKKITEVIEDYNLVFVTMTDYGPDITSIVAYEPQTIEATLAGAIAEAGLAQAHIAETEKYPHATYFLNGGKQEPHHNEEHVLIPSRKDVKTHDEAPEMRAKEIANAAIERLANNHFIFVNFANPDMVGHTAKREAIIAAVETVDRELGRLVAATIEKNGTLLIIADHGNAERMVDPETGEPHTAHTTNLVPCILVGNQQKKKQLMSTGGLQDVAPTILHLMHIKKPACMTGTSLLKK